MSKLHITMAKDGKTYASRYWLGDLKAKVNTAEIVGLGLKVCEELLDAEDKMLKEDLKR